MPKRSIFSTDALNQRCPTCGQLKVLMQPSNDFQYFGYNEGYKEEFCEIAERHLGRKSINKSKILVPFFFREYLNFGTKIQNLEQDSA